MKGRMLTVVFLLTIGCINGSYPNDLPGDVMTPSVPTAVQPAMTAAAAQSGSSPKFPTLWRKVAGVLGTICDKQTNMTAGPGKTGFDTVSVSQMPLLKYLKRYFLCFYMFLCIPDIS